MENCINIMQNLLLLHWFMRKKKAFNGYKKSFHNKLILIPFRWLCEEKPFRQGRKQERERNFSHFSSSSFWRDLWLSIWFMLLSLEISFRFLYTQIVKNSLFPLHTTVCELNNFWMRTFIFQLLLWWSWIMNDFVV